MQNLRRAMRHPRIVPLVTLVFPLLFTAGCGLGMDNAERLQRAQSAFDSNEYRAAIIDTRNILQQEPENRGARLLLGLSSLRVNDAATAEKELRRALDLGADPGEIAVDLGKALLALRQYERVLEEIRPELTDNAADRLSILRLRGDATMALGRPAEARDVYLEVLAADASDLPSKLGVVSTYMAEQNYGEARNTVDEALAIDAAYVPARLASGSLYMASRNNNAAVEEYTKAIELAKAASSKNEQITALIGLVEARLAQHELAAAKESLAQLQKLAPDNLSTVYLTARIAFLDQDYERAQAELQKILRVAPQNGAAKFLMGAVQLQRGNLGQAEMHLSSVVAASPGNADARKLLAEIRLRQDRADEAADILRPLLDVPGADAGVLNLAVRANIAAGEVDTAIGYLSRALESDPGNTDIQLDLAAAYLSAGEIEKAETLLASSADESQENSYRRDLLKVMTPLRRDDAATALKDAEAMAERWPEDARVRNLIGGIALSMEQPELARESFLAARELAPAEPSSYLNIARIDIQSGDLDSARQQYQAALEQQPESAGILVALAKLEARAGNSEATVEWLEKARAADTAAVAPRLLLARYYLGQRSFEAAEQAAGEAVAIAGSNAEAHNVLGLARQAIGEKAAALASFSEAATLDPDQPRYRMNQARAEMALGHREQAEDTLLGSEGLDLDDLQSAVMFASLKARGGETDKAMQIAKDLQSRHPDKAVPYALEAELLAAGKQYAEAVAVYNKALVLRPEDRRLALRAFRVRNSGSLDEPERPLLDYLDKRPLDAEMRLVVAQAYQARGASAAAVAAYEKVLATSPDSFVALNNLAWEYFQTGDPRAEEIARRAFEQSPENGSVADTLGWIQVKKGSLDEGIATLRKAVELSDGNPEVKYHLAAGLEAAGERDEARRMLEETLAGTDSFGSRQDAERLLESL